MTHVALPDSRLATLQVVEYFRPFLVGRVGWSRLDALLIVDLARGKTAWGAQRRRGIGQAAES